MFSLEWCRRVGLEHAGARLTQINRLFEAGLDFVKLDTNENMGVPAQYGVLRLPTVLVFSNGEIVKQFMGAVRGSGAGGAACVGGKNGTNRTEGTNGWVAGMAPWQVLTAGMRWST